MSLRTDALCAFALGLVLATGAGCTASARVSGSASAQGGAGRVEAVGHIEGSADEPLQEGEIRYDKGGELRYGGAILFAYNRADLQSDPGTAVVLENFRKFMAEHPNVSLRVEGHTDSRGSDDYNQRLSERRAESVRLWLQAHEVDEERLESQGLGEASPRTPEPAGCDDARPADPTPCETAWKANRRVEFHVTEGAETLTAAVASKPEPVEPQPAAQQQPTPTQEGRCPLLYGVRGEALGPNALIGVAGLILPTCWLELSIGLSYNVSSEDASVLAVNGGGNPPIVEGSAGARWINIPVRARAWFGGRHAFLLDLGAGYSDLKIEGSQGNAPLGDFEYVQTGSALFGSAGVGYGYRRPVGFRLGLLAGVVGFSGSKDDPDVSAQGWPAATADLLGAGLDVASDNVWDTKPYIEASFGWSFH